MQLSEEKLRELQDTLKSCPNIQAVHFATNGEYYFNAFDAEGKKYARCKQVPETGKDGVSVVGMKTIGIAEFAIVESKSREEILNPEEKKGKK